MNFWRQKEREAAGAAEAMAPSRTRWKRSPARPPISRRLLGRVAALRQRGLPAAMTRVWLPLRRSNTGLAGALARNSLLEPVVGSHGRQGRPDPGLILSPPGRGPRSSPRPMARCFIAGPYHKSGQVLILEITTGYDLVLAGLGRVTVRPNDQLLAGEPVGTMPQDPADEPALLRTAP